jgi:hypothetical protein
MIEKQAMRRLGLHLRIRIPPKEFQKLHPFLSFPVVHMSHGTQIVPNFREPITSWKPYKVNAIYLQQEDDLRDPKIEHYVPLDTGFGTTHPPDREEPGFESTYTAWALFLSGFLLILPWFGAMTFVKSRARLARLAAILSIILLPSWLCLLLIYFRYGSSVV